MPSKLIIISTALTFAAGAACAQSDDSEFTAADTDGSGGLSLEEVQAADVYASSEAFQAYDTDSSGELSADEYGVWVAARTSAQ